jgi:radical SAM superfamily enzyme YgiQ (UPF0313 family)
MDDKRTILLIQPWIEDFYATASRTQPVGLYYLAAALKKNIPGVRTVVYDALSGGHRETAPWPEEFAYLKRYFNPEGAGPLGLFRDYFRFGRPPEETERELRQYSPLLIGISANFSPYYRESLKMAELCKKIFPRTPVVMGGNHATMFPGSLLAARGSGGETLCDYVLRGEAEESLPELAAAVISGGDPERVANIVTANGLSAGLRPLVTPDRKKIAMPCFDGAVKEDHTAAGKPMSSLITSRSCPHRCSFCTIHEVFGYTYETRDPEDVKREVAARRKEGIEHFDIEDDNFTFDKEHAVKILDGIIAEGPGLSLSAMNGLSYLSLDRDIMIKMKRAGFRVINLAAVTADGAIKKGLNRAHTTGKLLETIRLAEEEGLEVLVSFMLGMPSQTITEMWGTISLLSAERCLLQPSPFYLTPGSGIYDEIKSDPSVKLASERKDPFFSARLTAMDLECANFGRDDIYTLWRLCRVINQIKGCLDSEEKRRSPIMEEGLAILRERKWRPYGDSVRGVPPFSEKAANILIRSPLGIRSPAKGNYLELGPDAGGTVGPANLFQPMR